MYLLNFFALQSVLARWFLDVSPRSIVKASQRKRAAFLMLEDVICEAWRLHFGTLRDHFDSSAARWRTMGAAGCTPLVQNKMTESIPRSDWSCSWKVLAF